MNGFLTGLSNDPRASLQSGLYTAESAISNLDLIASLKKPSGFYDPDNILEEDISNEEDDEDEVKTIESRSRNSRSPMLSFSNTDMAFRDNIMVAGSYHGFNIYELSTSGNPELITSVICPGGQGDVSIVGDLLILSLIHI